MLENVQIICNDRNTYIHTYIHTYISFQTGLVRLYVGLGLAPEKAIVGIPTYGRSYTLANPNQHGLHAPAVSKGEPGPVRHIRGVYTYTDVSIINIASPFFTIKEAFLEINVYRHPSTKE